MNGRERVANTIARKPADKIPLGFYAVDCDIVEKVIGRKTFVRDKIAVPLALAEGRRAEVAESFKHDTVEFYRKIDCADLIIPKEAALLPPKDYVPQPLKKIADDRWEDPRGRIFQAVFAANDFMCIHDPTRKPEYTAQDFDGAPPVRPPDDSVFEALDYLIAQLGAERYVCSAAGAAVMPLPGGFDAAMLTYALHPEVIHAANRRALAVLEKTVRAAVRPGSAGVHIGCDTAGTNGPFISPAMFRELCLPYMRQSVALIKQHAGQVNFHDCGMNVPLMEMFIEAGIDCYQSLQTTAGMEIGRLKKMFGSRLTFWGGIPMETLIDGTPAATRQAVRHALETGAPGGGFVLGPSHSIAYGVKYENFMALVDEYVRLRDKF